MARTFRTNYERAAGIEPDRCEICRELLARHLVRTFYTWARESTYEVCDECLVKLVPQLQAAKTEYRVGAL